jgi:membrane dipeptidase
MAHIRLLPLLIILFGAQFTSGSTIETIEEKAARIHRNVLTLDTHVDTPLLLARDGWDISRKNDPAGRGGQVDYPE